LVYGLYFLLGMGIVLLVATTPTNQKIHMPNIANLNNDNSRSFVEACNSRKGQFVELSFRSLPTPSKEFKGVVLEKTTTGIFRTGINYANLSPVKTAIEAGERGAVGSLPWGEWAVFPLVIVNKGKEYLRITTSPFHRPSVRYSVNGVEVSKEHFESHLSPSKRSQPQDEPTLVFNIEAGNLLGVAGTDLVEVVGGVQ
jgi:hypothetical protein